MTIKQFTFAYVFALLIIGSIISGKQLFIQTMLKNEEKSSTVINLAGRQRMLSQKIAKSVNLMVTQPSKEATQQLKKDVETWVETHEGLKYGDAQLGLPKEENVEILSELIALDKVINPIVISTQKVINKSYTQEDIAIINRLEKEFLMRMDEIVFTYDAQQTRFLERFSRIELLLFLLALMTLLAEGLFIFRPAARQITRFTNSLKQLNKSLRKETAVAKEAVQAKERFLTRLSHEIKTPLNGLLGSVDGIDLKQIPKEQTVFVRNAVNSGRHLHSLLDNILLYSQAQEEQPDIKMEEYSSREVEEQLLAIFQPLADSKNLKFSIANNLPVKIKSYEKFKVMQVLINLIGNAIKYTDEGYVRLTMSAADQNGHKKLEFFLEDTGRGFPDKDPDSVFESFQRGGMSNIKNVDGVGLGLAITSQILMRMKSQLYVASEKAVGTNIKFFIAFESIEDDRKENLEFLKNKKILAVEDNTINMMVLLNALKALPCKIESASDGQECVEMMKDSEFDLVLMDCQMPRMNGYEATTWIRKNIGTKPIVIALSASNEYLNSQEYEESGFDGSLGKPFNKAALVQFVKQKLSELDSTNLKNVG